MRKFIIGVMITGAAIAAPRTVAAEMTADATMSRDGSHDMDFNRGTWHTEITRYPDPFGNRSVTAHLAGTVTVRPVWNGKAWMEEIEADGPKSHWEAGTLFLYDPHAHQWSENFVNTAVGRVDSHPLIGEYRDGNIEFYSADEFNGRAILVRGIWSNIRRDSHSYEEDYSNDGGRTWNAAFIGHLTRIAD